MGDVTIAVGQVWRNHASGLNWKVIRALPEPMVVILVRHTPSGVIRRNEGFGALRARYVLVR